MDSVFMHGFADELVKVALKSRRLSGAIKEVVNKLDAIETGKVPVPKNYRETEGLLHTLWRSSSRRARKAKKLDMRRYNRRARKERNKELKEIQNSSDPLVGWDKI